MHCLYICYCVLRIDIFSGVRITMDNLSYFYTLDLLQVWFKNNIEKLLLLIFNYLLVYLHIVLSITWTLQCHYYGAFASHKYKLKQTHATSFKPSQCHPTFLNKHQAIQNPFSIGLWWWNYLWSCSFTPSLLFRSQHTATCDEQQAWRQHVNWKLQSSVHVDRGPHAHCLRMCRHPLT